MCRWREDWRQYCLSNSVMYMLSGAGSHSQTSFIHDKHLWWERTRAELCWNANKWCKFFVIELITDNVTIPLNMYYYMFSCLFVIKWNVKVNCGWSQLKFCKKVLFLCEVCWSTNCGQWGLELFKEIVMNFCVGLDLTYIAFDEIQIQ
jgi:hypothetical protein